MITVYNQEYLGGYGNKKKETDAITKFSSGVQTLMFEANENLIRLRSETNAIKIGMCGKNEIGESRPGFVSIDKN